MGDYVGDMTGHAKKC